MSGVLKSIGKVFKSVAKFVIKIAPYALAAAAVVFTGGAALGLLPTFSAAVGGLVGGLGLGTALTGALTGAITSAGFGAAIGGVLGGSKGLQKGALTGLLTGGLLGVASPAMFGIHAAGSTLSSLAAGTGTTAEAIDGVANSAAGAGAGLLQNSGLAALAGQAVPSAIQGAAGFTPDLGILGSGVGGASSAAGIVPSGIEGAAGDLSALGAGVGTTAPSVASSVTGAAIGAPAAAATGTGTGVLGLLNRNPLLASQLLGGISSAFTKPDGVQSIQAQQQAMQANAAAAYRGAYAGRPDVFGVPHWGLPPAIQASTVYTPRQTRWVWDPATNKVVERAN